VWAFNWGFVSGKTQTIYNATTWNVLPAYNGEPVPWHHDVLRPNGTAYLQSEKDYLLSYQENHKQSPSSPYPTVNHTGLNKPETPDADGSSFLFMDLLLLGLAVVSLGAVAFLWRRRELRRERQQFSIVNDLEDSFVADLELRPMD